MAFYYCEAMNGKLTLSSEVTAIGCYAFGFCYAFSGELVIPSKVETIGEWAFAYDRSLTSLKFNSGLKQIDPSAFYNCSNLKGNIIIPNTVTTIGNYAFQYLTNLDGYISIPNSVTTLGDSVFGWNPNLKRYYIGEGLTSIGTKCFCTNTTTDVKLYTKNQTVLDYDWETDKRNVLPMNTFQVTIPEEIILKPKYLNNQAAPIWYASFNIEVSGDFEDGSYGTFSKVPTFDISTTSGEQITITTDVRDTTVTEDGTMLIPVTFTAPNPTLLKDYSGIFTLDTILHEIVPFAA